MDEAARRRLKLALTESPIDAQDIGPKFGWSASYVSRIVSGDIKSPPSDKLLKICQALGVDMMFILTGETSQNSRKALLNELATAPQTIIDQVAEFVNSRGLNRLDDDE